MPKTLKEINAQRRKHYLEVKDRINAERKLKYLAKKEVILNKIKEDRKLNPEKYRRLARLRYIKNKDKIKQQMQESRLRCRERVLKGLKKYRENNKETLKIYFKDYYTINRDKLINYSSQYKLKREKIDLDFKLKRLYCHRVRQALKGKKVTKKIELLGCTIQEFKLYFESKFTEGMNWDKVKSGEIHIDHIKPVALFDINNYEEVKKCFHYTNLQPLWALDNISKGKKYFC